MVQLYVSLQIIRFSKISINCIFDKKYFDKKKIRFFKLKPSQQKKRKFGFENGRETFETFPFGDIFNLNLILNGDFSIATEFKVTPWHDFHS